MREWKEKRQAMQHYDQQAAIYNVQYLIEQKAKIEEILKKIKFGSNEVVLDIGCGTGFLFQHIAKRERVLIGIDLSKKTLQESKKRTTNLSSTMLIRADADYLPFPDSIFDKVFAITLMQNMPEPLKTIREMKRIGKPQSVFAVTGLKKKFTTKTLVNLLDRAQLKVVTLTSCQRLKGHVAICTNQ